MIQSAIPSNYLSLFRLPRGIANLLGKKIDNFYWIVQMEILVHILSLGVQLHNQKKKLGIGNWELISMKQSTIWKMVFPDSSRRWGVLWSQGIRSKCGLQDKKWDPFRTTSIVLGNSSHQFRNVRSWKDFWLGDSPFPLQFPYSIMLITCSFLLSYLCLGSFSWNLSDS